MVSIQITAATIFAIALVHTFSTRYFERLAHTQPQHAGVWQLLGEVEVVFGLWAMALIGVMALYAGKHHALEYLDSRNFTEPLFVFAIMVVCGSRAILELANHLVDGIAARLPLSRPAAVYFVTLGFVPLLGSLITEPAAMTLGAMILSNQIFGAKISRGLRYATIGVLFVNISIGGTLTPFAAPPVLMVAAKWNWDTTYMMTHFGWRSAIAVAFNAFAVTWLFRSELTRIKVLDSTSQSGLPRWVVLVHLLFLIGIVALAHHPAAFLGLLLFFMGFASAYPQFQNRLILREGLMVAFFLGGLVVLGGQQQWWLDPLLRSMDSTTVYFGATLLTAVTDNAALTYLGSLVDGLSEDFKYSLVAGAVTGGGLTVIANAPNPAGAALLRRHFTDENIHPLGLLLAALPPTLVAIVAFRLL